MVLGTCTYSFSSGVYLSLNYSNQTLSELVQKNDSCPFNPHKSLIPVGMYEVYTNQYVSESVTRRVFVIEKYNWHH